GWRIESGISLREDKSSLNIRVFKVQNTRRARSIRLPERVAVVSKRLAQRSLENLQELCIRLELESKGVLLAVIARGPGKDGGFQSRGIYMERVANGCD